MARTIADRLTEATSRSFVGRDAELELLRGAAVDPDPPFLVGFVHGPGGIGKSSLLTALAASLEPDVPVLRLDCRDVEPTPRGVVEAAAAALGEGASEASLDDVTAALAARPGRTLLALDTYELFAILDAWMRQVFLPRLPDSVAVVIASRDGPSAAWLTDPGWAGMVREVRLRALSQADAIRMLRARGLGELQAARANRFARGHPLALELAAAALRDDPDPGIEVDPPSDVVGQLLDALLEDLPPHTIETVEAASTTRRVTAPILRALLARDDIREAFDDLRRLPFTERTPEGLLLHDVVRDTVARELAERDPELHARYRRRAWAFLSAGARHPRAGGDMWQLTADLIFLIKNPVLRYACFPVGAGEHVVEPATPDDADAIARIVGDHEGPEARDLLLAWWRRHPEAFSVARSPDGTPAALVHVAEIGSVDPELLRIDPVASAWREHLRRVPPRAGDRVLAMRRWLGAETGELLAPEVGACWLDVKRVYLQLRPRLSRLYSTMGDPAALAPIFVPLGFAPVGEPVAIGGGSYQPVWLDFGEGSVDGWLSRLVDAEIDAAEEAGRRDAAADDGLTAREREVLALIADGLSNRGIAERLVISEKTAGRHVSNIFAKLGIHNRAQAARIAAERGLAGAAPGG
jgi:DNA-binding CsgD family transcriptional regulator